jgi:hypothetical protein
MKLLSPDTHQGERPPAANMSLALRVRRAAKTPIASVPMT